MKKHIALLLAVFLIFVFCGCGSESEKKDFHVSGMTISLDRGFNGKDYGIFTACYESSDMLIAILKEEFDVLKDIGIDEKNTVKEYAGTVMRNNGLDEDIVEKDELTGFSFEQTVDDESYMYNAYVYKAEDSFWLIQFTTYSDKYEELQGKIEEYAKSVKI